MSKQCTAVFKACDLFLILFTHISLFLMLFAFILILFADILLESSRWTTIGSINGCFSNSSHRSIRSALKSVRESRHTRFKRADTPGIYVYTCIRIPIRYMRIQIRYKHIPDTRHSRQKFNCGSLHHSAC